MLPTAKQLIMQSVDIYKRHAAMILKYVLLTLLPTVILVPFAGITGVIALITKQGSGPMMASFMVLAALAFLALMVLSIWFSIALTRVINKLHIGQPVGTIRTEVQDAKQVLLNGIGVSLLAAFYAGWPLIVALVGWFILRGIVLVAAINERVFTFLSIFFALLGVYGAVHMIIYALRLAFSYYEVILNGVGVKESIKTSTQMVQGRWWSIFWRFFAPVLLLWLVLGLLQLLLGTLGGLIDNAIVSGFLAFVLLIVQYLLSPIIMIVGIILYTAVRQPKSNVETPPAQETT